MYMLKGSRARADRRTASPSTSTAGLGEYVTACYSAMAYVIMIRLARHSYSVHA